MNFALLVAFALSLPGLPANHALTTYPAERDVRIVVISPHDPDQPAQPVFLHSSIDDWREPGRALAPLAGGVNAGTVRCTGHNRVEFKFTRTGRWSSVEKSASGADVANRRFEFNLHLNDPNLRTTVFAVVERWADRDWSPPVVASPAAPIAGPAARAKSTLTGDIRVHADFESPQLHNRRTLRVWLPPGYDANTQRRYPVIYLHDGQNCFDAVTSFIGVEWQADETADRLIRENKIPPIIMVAIDNNADRAGEYTTQRDREHGGGNGDAYLAFVVETVKPYIDRTYRTQPGRQSTAIAGSSLGGLISLDAAWKYPRVFGQAGVISPALWWADRHAIAMAKKTPTPRPRLWIDMGTAEGSDQGRLARFATGVDDCRALVANLRAAGYSSDADLRFEVISNGQHNERDWAARFDRVLIFLFAGTP